MTEDKIECPLCESSEGQEFVEKFEHKDHIEVTYYCPDCGEEYCILELTDRIPDATH